MFLAKFVRGLVLLVYFAFLKRSYLSIYLFYYFRRPAMTIHPPPPAVSIQRPQGTRDTATRITLPSHPAVGAQKPQPPHTMTQVTTLDDALPKYAIFILHNN